MPGPFNYQNNIPQATDQLSVSQADIQQNFGSLQSILEVNHETFASTDAGKHKFITFPVQGITPTFTASEYGVFNQFDPVSATNQIYLHNPVTSQQVPFAQSNLNTIGTTGLRNGWFFLPCGFMVKFGVINTVTNGVASYNLPNTDFTGIAIPSFAFKLLFVAAWPLVNSGDYTISATNNGISLTSVNIYNSNALSTSVSFVAVGF